MFEVNSDGSVLGKFTDGNAGAGQVATVVPANWLNMVQAELKAFLDSESLTPNPADSTQVLQAVQGMIGKRAGRNAVINGDMRIAQRTTSASFAHAGVLSGYVLDRWLAQCDATTGAGECTVSRQAHTPGGTPITSNPANFLRFQQTVASTLAAPTLVTKIERVSRWSGGKATLSCWLRGTTSFDVTASITQNFGTGGGVSTPVLAGTTIFAVNSVWQLFKLTVDLPTVLGKTFGAPTTDHLLIKFAMPTGQVFLLEMSDVQLEPGAVASEFEYRSPTLELAMCERYFEKVYDLENAVGQSQGGILNSVYQQPSVGGAAVQAFQTRFRTQKRILPTMTWYSVAGATGFVTFNGVTGDIAVTGTLNASAATSGYPLLASNPASGIPVSTRWTADAEVP